MSTPTTITVQTPLGSGPMPLSALYSESDAKRNFIEENREELVTALSASWRNAVLEFLKTHGCLTAEGSEIIGQAGPSRRRAEALVSFILSHEDIRKLWKSFWLGLSRYCHVVYKQFEHRIENELGYQALLGIATVSPRDQLQIPGIDSTRPALSAGDGQASLDAVSGGAADSDAVTGRLSSVPNRLTESELLASSERYREERNVARKERSEAVEANQRLTAEIYHLRENRSELLAEKQRLDTLTARLTEKNTELTANCEELTARVEVMRETEKQQLQDSNATLEHLQVLQHKEKQHQSIVIDWMSQVQALKSEAKKKTLECDAAQHALKESQARAEALRLAKDAVDRELAECRAKLTNSLPIDCVRFAQCRHSASDSGVQSDTYMVEGHEEVPIVFLREVDFSVKLPVESNASGSFEADNAILITGVAGNAVMEGANLLVGDEVREVNGGTCNDIHDFRQRISGTEKPLNIGVRRRLVYRDCKSCSQESGTINSPVSVLPPTTVENLSRGQQPFAAVINRPSAVSPSYSNITIDGEDGDRPQSSAGMCAISSTSSNGVQHKTEVAAACSTENLPEELSTEEQTPDVSPEPALEVKRSPQKSNLRVRLNVKELRPDGAGTDSPKIWDRNRSNSIPHISKNSLAAQSNTRLYKRRSSEPYVFDVGSTPLLLRSAPLQGSMPLHGSGQISVDQDENVTVTRRLDVPVRFNEEQLESMLRSNPQMREIAFHRGSSEDPDDSSEIELVGGRGAGGAYIKAAPQWVLNHNVRIGDRIIYVHVKNVGNAPLQLVQFCLDNTISFNGIGHIIVESDEQGYQQVISGKQSEDFYVRSNFNAVAQRPGDLNILCGDILHVRNSMYRDEIGKWFATKVEHYKDSDRSGVVPCPQTARRYVIETGHGPKNLTSDQRPVPTDMTSTGCGSDQDSDSDGEMERATPGCSPHHAAQDRQDPRKHSTSHLEGDAADANHLGGRFLKRAKGLLGIGTQQGRRRGSKTVTQLAPAIAMALHTKATVTPPYEYIELVKEERARPVILFGSFSYYVIRELQRQYSSYYSVCRKTYFKTLAEREEVIKSGKVIYVQPIETQQGFECITMDNVQDSLNRDLCPLIEPDMGCVSRMQRHGVYAITICLRPASKAKLKNFIESLSRRPFSDSEVSEEIAVVRDSFDANKHMLTDVMEIKANPDRDIPRLHRLIQKNLRSLSWVSSLDQPDFSFEVHY